jgi:putative transposase
VTPPKEEDKIVDVLVWCEMPNHFHVMTYNRVEKGASLFTQKVTGGYTMQFNLHHQRSGTLFQGRTKIIPVIHDAHWLHLPFYILSNPLDLYQPGWKERRVRDPQKAFEFLKNYRWSALSGLLGKENFSQIVNRDFFFDLFDLNERRLKKQFIEWLAEYDHSGGTPFAKHFRR